MNAPPQHMQALELANRIRLHQSHTLAELRAGTLTIREVLFSEDEELGSIPLARLLRTRRGWGTYRVASFCRRMALNELRPIRKLTARQKDAIAGAVEEGHRGAD